MIKDAYNNTCSQRVLSVFSNKEPIQIENKSLNGMMHLQTIGTAMNVAMVKALCSFAEYENLVEAAGSAVPIQVDFDGKYYDGIMRGQPIMEQYSRGITRSRRLHQVSFNMFVEEQG